MHPNITILLKYQTKDKIDYNVLKHASNSILVLYNSENTSKMQITCDISLFVINEFLSRINIPLPNFAKLFRKLT